MSSYSDIEHTHFYKQIKFHYKQVPPRGSNTVDSCRRRSSSNTKTVIHNLQPGTSYEFQVIGKNVLGDGMFSNIVKERTKGIHNLLAYIYNLYIYIYLYIHVYIPD